MEHQVKQRNRQAGTRQSNGGQGCAFFAPAAVQPKLTVNAPNDRYEREADAVADKVMRMPASLTAPVQRKCAHCEEEEKKQLQRKPVRASITPLLQRKAVNRDRSVGEHFSSSLQASKGSGKLLPQETRSWMESRFGADFSSVKIHTGGKAVQLSRDLNARAFAHGSDIYFNQGEFAPGTIAGKQLLAHELTHVVQQGGDGGHLQRWTYGAGDHNTSGGNTFREITAAERQGPNGMDAAMAIVDRLVAGSDWRSETCQQWYTDNCDVARSLADLNNRAVIWMWREADGSGGNGLTDGANGEHHAVTEQLFNIRSRWALAATILHEYWHDCENSAVDIGDDAKAACGLPNI
ncbi:uncharacterized protein DUF4157 [Anseongella ginsenosidimutans]|uniref:Uncharacterized protein DUF4157 n=1 Tax=Anseongella ginsenosidimutans TaxID=496056 RepID=A0A4R3KRJ1_9SPHI|nr:DUF4157 domain-containing protein [Anseongella ginsenosidimutans]QEC53854.1 DUF4157 domain-containing protein [Anseongella ginsenosidimutans]TCS86233.1 uncharacterized protein DUF4157 [Anseongella ginsenosidimutans]